MKEQEAEPSSPSAQNLDRLPTVCVPQFPTCKMEAGLHGAGEADDTNLTN